MNLSIEKKQTHRQRADLWLPRERGMGWGGTDGKFGVDRYKLLYLEWVSNEVLLNSTGN